MLRITLPSRQNAGNEQDRATTTPSLVHINSQMGMCPDVIGVFQPFPALVAGARDPPQKPDTRQKSVKRYRPIQTLALHAPSACTSYSVLSASGVFQPFPALADDAQDHAPVSVSCGHCANPELLHHVHQHICSQIGMSDVAGVFQPFPALIADARDPPQKSEKHVMEVIRIVATSPVALH